MQASIVLGIITNLIHNGQCPLGSTHYPLCSNVSREYDFIIVGGGAAGSVIANRLSENPDWNVLLLEAGHLPPDIAKIPAMFALLQNEDYDWNLRSEPNDSFRGFENARIPLPQGKMLGGSSGISCLLHTPPISEDIDNWIRQIKPTDSREDIETNLQKIYDKVKIHYYESQMPTRNILLDTANELNLEVNQNGSLGFKDVLIRTQQGVRHSTAQAYLGDVTRDNLCILLNSHVKSIKIHNGRATGVHVQIGTTSTFFKATKEVILTAGVYNTPKLLMLSGIGPKKHLQKLGISLIKDAPVGQNLQDAPGIPVFISVPNLDIQIDYIQTLQQFCQFRKGLDNVDIFNFYGLIKTSNNSTNNLPNLGISYFTLFKSDKFIFNVLLAAYNFATAYKKQFNVFNEKTMGMFGLINLLYPKSRGEVFLRDNDYKSPPMITPGYFNDKNEEDLEEMWKGFEFQLKMLKTKAMQHMKILEVNMPHCKAPFGTKEYWKCYIKTFAMTLYHTCGTAVMSNDETTGVVDTHFKVWGVDGLRVMDASAMPGLMSGHLEAPVNAFAELGAWYIKRDYAGTVDKAK